MNTIRIPKRLRNLRIEQHIFVKLVLLSSSKYIGRFFISNEPSYTLLYSSSDSLSADKITKEEILANGEREVRSILKDIDSNQKEIGTKLFESYQESNIIGDCSCGGKLLKKYSKRNKEYFIGCSKFPTCRNTYSLPKGANILKSTCPTCGLPMISIKKKGQKGREHVCLDPNCGKEVSKRRAPEVVGKCPECGRDLLKRHGRYGEFVGCSGFPQCRFSCQLKDLDNLGKEELEVKENNSK